MTYLIIRFSTIGNVAMTVPVVASLSRRYPDDQFIIAAKKDLSAMFVSMPNVVKAAAVGARLSARAEGGADDRGSRSE